MLKEILQRHFGKSKSEIASALGVSKNTVKEWWDNERYPNVDEIRFLAKKAGIDMLEIWLALYDNEAVEYEKEEQAKSEKETLLNIEVTNQSEHNS